MTLQLNYKNIFKVMTCDGRRGDKPTDTNNIVDIFDAHQVQVLPGGRLPLLTTAPFSSRGAPTPIVATAVFEAGCRLECAGLDIGNDLDPEGAVCGINSVPLVTEMVQVFNISEQLDQASSIVTDNAGLLTEPKSTVVSAQVSRAIHLHSYR